MKYIDADKLKAHIESKMEILWDKLPDADKEHPTDIELRDLGMYIALEGLIDDLDSLQQEFEVNEFSFQGGTATINGVEHSFKPGKAKVIILDITENED